MNITLTRILDGYYKIRVNEHEVACPFYLVDFAIECLCEIVDEQREGIDCQATRQAATAEAK